MKHKFKCIKGMADSDNINVVVMKNDIVEFLNYSDAFEGFIEVVGIKGWCKGVELIFKPNQIVEHFEIILK